MIGSEQTLTLTAIKVGKLIFKPTHLRHAERKTLDQQAQSRDLAVRRHATWGMSAKGFRMADHVAEKMREYLGDAQNTQGKSKEAILREFIESEGILDEDLDYLILKLIPMIESALAGGSRHE